MEDLSCGSGVYLGPGVLSLASRNVLSKKRANNNRAEHMSTHVSSFIISFSLLVICSFSLTTDCCVSQAYQGCYPATYGLDDKLTPSYKQWL